MKISLSKAEMIERRRRALALDPLRTDCTIERTDGIDVDATLEQELRRWYLNLLDTAPRRLLAPENIAGRLACSTSGEGAAKAAVIELPSNCRRVFDVKLDGWTHAVEVLPHSELSRVLACQNNPYTRATASCPVAVLGAGGADGRCADILAWPIVDLFPAASIVTAALDPGPELYTLDESAL
ncbi:MAG: hypothetical protein NC418_09550 [Muribaculaceae bacterium]|nr:hypothetical protein [Muribaculaceae bacterium]